jgi:hypothetical protein
MHPTSTPTILLADDEHHIRLVLADRLLKAGFAVLQAADGDEALQLARQKLPAFIITDLQMPRMSGLDLCLALRESAATASIPAILLTARGYLASTSEISRTSIRDVIAKPFSAREVVERVKSILADSATALRSAA